MGVQQPQIISLLRPDPSATPASALCLLHQCHHVCQAQGLDPRRPSPSHQTPWQWRNITCHCPRPWMWSHTDPGNHQRQRRHSEALDKWYWKSNCPLCTTQALQLWGPQWSRLPLVLWSQKSPHTCHRKACSGNLMSLNPDEWNLKKILHIWSMYCLSMFAFCLISFLSIFRKRRCCSQWRWTTTISLQATAGWIDGDSATMSNGPSWVVKHLMSTLSP